MKKLLVLLIFSVFLFSSNSYELPFDKSKLNNYDAQSDLTNYVGSIKNQVWIYSKTLSEIQLKDKIFNLYKFKIIGFDKLYGLLIEFDETDKYQLEIVNKIKYLDDIDNVFHRVYEGKKAFKAIKMNVNNL